ncbi:ABC transporter permease [Pseudonocardia xinjiangensis]|uniref:ABC transporter permease n=1 Tax=Pseudonocardia xinjiangensis TaxID=75289 RepID=A0ABX1RKE3_9PSEU|nr:ABC transporter permease [Pseudonocardia xinjiangensis]NMH80866.1 ABC transporter permease [Pseudonocardia xinjiangensis]
MIGIAARTLAARWAGFTGTALALVLGVALVTTTLLCLFATLDRRDGPPAWFAGADAVVIGTDGPGSVTTAAVPATAVTRLAGAEGVLSAVPDRRAPVEAAGRTWTARPWSTARFQTGGLVAGGAPDSGDEIVLPASAGAAPGSVLRVHTVDGPRVLTVSGVLEGSLPVAYVRDDVVTGWAGARVDAVALRLAPGAPAPAGLGADTRVLTGPDRVDAEPDPDAVRRMLGVTLLGNAAAVATLAATFVVAGTFSYSVAQRRRELALLRMSGAAPRQIRRMVRAEAMLVGLVAACLGTALGRLGAPPVAAWLVDAGFAPPDLTIRTEWAPIAAAGLVGLGTAWLGVTAAARRAGAVRPLEALRDAAVDRRVMGRGRWVGAALLGATAIGVVPLALGETTGVASAYVLLVTIATLLALALLTPVLVPLLLAPVTALTSSGVGLIGSANVRAGLRRTASTAAPVLITVGLAAATLASTATLTATAAAAERDRVTAEIVVSASGPVGLDRELVAGLAGVPGVAAVEPTAGASASVDAGSSGVRQVAVTYASSGIGTAMRLPLVAGALAGLDRPDTAAVSEATARDHGWQVGATAHLRPADGAAVRPTVVAVVADHAMGGSAALLSWPTAGGTAGRTSPDTAYVALAPGADPAAALRAVGALATAHGATAGATGDVLADRTAGDEEIDRLAVLSVIGLTITYTAISIATTFVMSTAARRRELTALRLTGATPLQLTTMIVVEVGLVVLAAVALAGLTTAVVLALTAAVLAGTGPLVLSVPWGPVALACAGCLLIALVAGLAPAADALRRPPLHAPGVR